MPETSDYKFLNSPMTEVKEVSTRRAALLDRLGISNLKDALYYFPFRHEDYTTILRPDQLEDGKEATCYGRVVRMEERELEGRRTLLKVVIENSGGYVAGVFFNQKWLKDNFKDGGKVLFHGVCKASRYGLAFSSPKVTYLDDDFHPDDYKGERLPIYRTTEALPQKTLLRIMKNALELALPHVAEYLPDEIGRRYGLMKLPEAIRLMHFPGNSPPQELERARRRLVVDELAALNLGLWQMRRILQRENYEARHEVPGDLIRRFLKILPFKLTDSQTHVLHEIKLDMLADRPMHRLLQGDVGSGKTVVAATAMLMAVEGGYNAAIMAPTEILARQHYGLLKKWGDQLGIEVLYSSGGQKRKERDSIMERLKDGSPVLLCGTHSLLHLGGELPRLGLLVIDEQHKFGVAQRAALREVSIVPDTLVMTATPIPRSLAMTTYGDMDISILAKPPMGRKPITTKVVTPDRLQQVWQYVRKQVYKGRQAYVVYPQVEESEKRACHAAEEMYKVLSAQIFPDLKVGLVHGKLRQEEKEKAMRDFKEGRTDVLVCTTVIEVGVDVPNASVMIIEDAQRFGLAQLHQLRGRIGRGEYASLCVLVDNTRLEKNPDGSMQPVLSGMSDNPRLAVMARTCDGFEIAEEDLDIRGMGELFGEKQSGQFGLRLFNPKNDRGEMDLSKELAFHLMDSLEKGELNDPYREALLTRIAMQYGEEFRLPGF